MSDPFLAKIIRDGLLEEDVESLGNSYRSIVNVNARCDIVGRSLSSRQIHVLIEGWACKYRLMADGRRQIVQIHLAGDICDLDKICRDDIDFGVLALSNCRVATISLDWIRKTVEERPAIRDLLWSFTALDNLSMGELVVSLGRRTARERTAYLLCDLLERLQGLGQALDCKFRVPLTQVDIGDHLGLSTVHVNRTLQDLKSDCLIHTDGRAYEVSNRTGLERLANFTRRQAAQTERRAALV